MSKRFIVASDLKEVYVLINPEIIAFSERTEDETEGCLSIPAIQGSVPRSYKIIVRARKPDGQAIELTAKGLLARVIQHEIDHLDGVLFIDRSLPDSLVVADHKGEDDENLTYRKTNVQEIQKLFKENYHQKNQKIQFEIESSTEMS